VLRGVDFSASAASITSLIGPNGAGKTTLFRTLLGFQAADRGTCTIDGLDSRRYRQTAGIGYAPESLAFPLAWTVRDVLACGVGLAVPPPARRAAFALAVQRGGFDDGVLARGANRCSKGIQQRIKLAFALIGDPHLVIMDEPFSGLDPGARRELRRAILATKSGGATILLASHDLAEVVRLTDAVYVLDGGRTRPVPVPGLDRDGFETDLEEAVVEDRS